MTPADVFMPRTLVTGASGFVGSAVVRQMLARGWPTAALVRNPDRAVRLRPYRDRVTMVQGDLTALERCEEAIAAFQPTAIVHIGWDGVLGAARNDIGQVDNVPSSLELMRLASRCGVRHFVGFGSQAEYGPCQNRIDETQPTHPTTVYGAAKLATYHLLERMAGVSGIGFAWMRLFSSYGPGDDPSWMISYLCRTLLDGQRPSLTAAEQLWDYIYVDDVAGAVLAVLEARAEGPFNLGSGTAQSLRSLIERIRDLIDPSLPLGFGEVPYRPDQVMHLEANIDRLVAATGWRPQTRLEDGLAQTVAWHKESRGNG